MRKDEEAMAQWTRELPLACAKMDYEILKSADKMLKEMVFLFIQPVHFQKKRMKILFLFL